MLPAAFAPNVLILPKYDTFGVLPSSYFTVLSAASAMQTGWKRGMRLTCLRWAAETGVLRLRIEKIFSKLLRRRSGKSLCQRRVGNSIPIFPIQLPSPCTTDGVVKLKVKTNSSSSVLVGRLPVRYRAATVGTPPRRRCASATVAPKKAKPMLNDTESYFNKAMP